MKLGIMQPYFFPYLGYFDLIRQVDRWIVFDTPQYIHHGWVNRNRILNPQESWQYVIVPLKKHAREAAIRDVEINDSSRWRELLLKQLQHYRKPAPYFEPTFELVRQCLDGPETSLSRLNTRILKCVCEKLKLFPQWDVFSEMNLDLGPIEGPGDWALRISEALGATEYINPPGGADLFDPARFEASGIKLTLNAFQNMPYRCGKFEFIPGLSIIDVMMWNSPESIRQYLDDPASRAAEPATPEAAETAHSH